MIKKKVKKTKTLRGGKKLRKTEKFQTEPLAVGFYKRSLYLLFRKFSSDGMELRMTSGKFGTKFEGSSHKIKIVDPKNREENVALCSGFRLSSGEDSFIMTYVRDTEAGNVLVYAESKDKKKWVIKYSISKIKTSGIVTFGDGKKQPNIYFGNDVLKVASLEKNKWEIFFPPRVPHWHFFDGIPFDVIGSVSTKEHLTVFYSAVHTVNIMKDVNLSDVKVGEERLLKIGAAIFSKKEKTRLLWQAELPVIEVPLETHGMIRVLGIVPFESKSEKTFHIYTASENGEMGFIDLPEDAVSDHKDRKQLLLKKWQNNPILSPTHLDWEKDGAFNPTALRLGGKVHLLYRAVGSNGYSSIGYASSSDGLHIDERLRKPVYTPHYWYEKGDGLAPKSFELFSSGGGWGGCEDPKLTKIGNRIYMTYVAFNGSWPTRTVLTSISVDDFLNKKWRWSRAQLMSPPGVGSKSVVLFPEKINGKYYIFHRMWPNIMLDIVPELEFGQGKRWLKGEHMIRPRKSFWDSFKISVGATPIKTKEGWLVIYNAVDRLDGGKYKIGAMLLDLYDPTKVIARCRRPILSPEEFYENDGKPGIAYPGGAVDIDGMLHVYYGGGDKVCAVAQIPTEELLQSLLKDAGPKAKIQRIK